MPKCHGRFARFPTQIDRLSLALGGEVEQPEVDIFDNASKRFDAMDEPMYFELQIAEPRRRKR